ncbi:hypothetical protein AHAS_Ahas15G0149400 [Arachis hypogaea]
MATHGRGRTRTRGETENNQLADNHAEFMAAMANLANTMEANAAATLQVIQRLGQPGGNRNRNGDGNGNGDGEGNDLGGAPMTLASFLKVYPPTFRGSTNSTEPDNRFRAMERALQAQHVPGNQYVEFAAYQLLGEAQHWWQGECQLLRLPNAEISWDVFQRAFYRKFFPESMREAKELELMQLKQGSLSMAEYTSRFEELCRFCRIRIFSELGNKVRVVEDCAKKVTEARGNCGYTNNRSRGDYLGPRDRTLREMDTLLSIFMVKETSEGQQYSVPPDKRRSSMLYLWASWTYIQVLPPWEEPICG